MEHDGRGGGNGDGEQAGGPEHGPDDQAPPKRPLLGHTPVFIR